MPCYSQIETVLIDIATIEKAAALLGITVSRRNANSYVLQKGSERIIIDRTGEGEKFYTSASQNGIIKPLSQAYAKEMIKAFAKKKGYVVSAGSKPGEIILTQY